MCVVKARYTLCDIGRLISLLQATLCNADLINLGTMLDLMRADCAMITPADLQSATQDNEMSLVCAASCVRHT